MKCWALLLFTVPAFGATQLTLARNGKAEMAILIGEQKAPAQDLRDYLGRISGAAFEVRPAKAGEHGIHVGLASEFPWLNPGETRLGAEGYLVRSTAEDVFLLGEQAAGVEHAVAAFLESLGCRWLFPGKTWEVIPPKRTIEGAWNLRREPVFPLQHSFWYGHGAPPECVRDFDAWKRRNGLGGSQRIWNGHTWYGMDPEKDFAKHPEWFGLVEGKRRPDKPCYSNPEVVRQAIDYAMEHAAKGVEMVSLTPPDYMGFCECDRCRATLRGGAPFHEFGALFGRLENGVVLSATSETLFEFANQVAEAVAAKYPKTLLGILAYSAYSQPPSFKLHPNLFLQTTAEIRRTQLPLDEQLDQLKQRVSRIGIYEYFSVYHWDWDYPNPAKVAPAPLVNNLRLYASKGVTSLNAEASNNWAARGIGYYLSAKLMWDLDTDVKAVVDDFFSKAFGAAAAPMRRYFDRWYRFDARPPAVAAKYILPDRPNPDRELTDEVMRAAFRELDEAATLAKDDAGALARVDHIRMYLHYMFLRRQLEKTGSLAAIREETLFAGRLTYTNMIHFQPIINREFPRRFKKYEAQLATVSEAQKKSWIRIGQPPDHDELERLWEADKQALFKD